MKRKTGIIVLSIVLVLLVVALVIGLTGSETGRTIQSETIKIGATFPLSGQYSFVGQDMLNAMNLAIEEINIKGGIAGKELVIIAEDNKGDATEANTNVNKLINLDKTEIIFSTYTHITEAIKKPIFDANKILIYASTVSNIAREDEYAFRDYFDATDNGIAVAQKVKKLGINKVYFLTEVSSQCLEYTEAFEKEATNLGITIIKKEEFQVTDTSLKTNLLKLGLSKEDKLVTCTWRHEHILMKEMKELGLIEVQTFHWVAPFFEISNTAEMKELYEENKAISAWYGLAEVSEKDLQKQFIKKYEEKYGNTPSPNAAYAYDDMKLLSQALNACNGNAKNKDCISSYLKEKTYDGVGGELYFDKNGVSRREVLFIQVMDGQWKEIGF